MTTTQFVLSPLAGKRPGVVLFVVEMWRLMGKIGDVNGEVFKTSYSSVLIGINFCENALESHFK